MTPSFIFDVPGHRTRYNLTALLPFYGATFCERLAEAWKQATVFENGESSYNYFKTMRRFFERIAVQGLNEAKSPERRVMECLRDGVDLSLVEKQWRQVVSNAAAAILTNGDISFIKTDNPTSRNKKLEGLRSAIERLHRQNFVPHCLPEGRLDERGAVTPKCLATLSFEAGRLDVTGMSLERVYETFIHRNREMLDELRRELWQELKQNVDLYNAGQSLSRRHPIDLSLLQHELDAHTLVEIAEGKVSVSLGLNKEQELEAALTLLRHRARGGEYSVDFKRIRKFVGRIISNAEAQPYFEATTVAFNAAYHIVLIDTGANPQPIDDLTLNLFKGSTRRGRRKISTLRLQKNRALGKVIPANLPNDDLYLSTKGSNGMPSGASVVEFYITLSQSMRQPSGPTSERLWVWRTAGATEVRTSMVSMASDRWPAFLERIKANPLLGGLSITRQIIRKAVANSRGEEGDLDFAIRQALLGHSHGKTTFQYLSEGAVLALLNSKIREFLNSLEAVTAIGVEDAARLLGIPTEEFYRREQLGLANGLAFATTRAPDEEADSGNLTSSLAEAGKILSASTQNIIALELARRALHQQYADMVNVNPARFLRVWVPWLALVEGYCERLRLSRFRARFKKAIDEVEKGLQTGALRLPILW